MMAHKVGIPIFVTGGIGGVHRQGQTTMDISADLKELGRTPVAVICAGVKSILDIGRTLEYLETQGQGDQIWLFVAGKFLETYLVNGGLKKFNVAVSIFGLTEHFVGEARNLFQHQI